MSSETAGILLLCRRAPYAGQLAKAALDIALTASVFEQDISILFMDEGVWQLVCNQESAGVGVKSIEKSLASFPLYDLNKMYVDQDSLATRGLSDEQLNSHVELVAAADLAVFIDGFKQIISC